MLTKFCCFGQSMDFADNAKFVKRVLLSFSSVALFHLSFPVQGLAYIQANGGYAAWSAPDYRLEYTASSRLKT